MKSLLALALVSLFAFSVVSTVAVAACGAKHCVTGDTECEKKKKDKTTGAYLFLTNAFSCRSETQPLLEALQSSLKSPSLYRHLDRRSYPGYFQLNSKSFNVLYYDEPQETAD